MHSSVENGWCSLASIPSSISFADSFRFQRAYSPWIVGSNLDSFVSFFSEFLLVALAGFLCVFTRFCYDSLRTNHFLFLHRCSPTVLYGVLPSFFYFSFFERQSTESTARQSIQVWRLVCKWAPATRMRTSTGSSSASASRRHCSAGASLFGYRHTISSAVQQKKWRRRRMKKKNYTAKTRRLHWMPCNSWQTTNKLDQWNRVKDERYHVNLIERISEEKLGDHPRRRRLG